MATEPGIPRFQVANKFVDDGDRCRRAVDEIIQDVEIAEDAIALRRSGVAAWFLRHQESVIPGRCAFLEDAGLDELGEKLVHHLLLHGINAVWAEFDRRGTRLERDVVFEAGSSNVPVVVESDIIVSAVPEHAVVEAGTLVIRRKSASGDRGIIG